MGIGDLIPIVQNGVTKKLPYSGLTGSLHFFSDSIFVKYRCHKIKGESQWYFSGDTIYIDTCYVAMVPGSPDSCLFEFMEIQSGIKMGIKSCWTIASI